MGESEQASGAGRGVALWELAGLGIALAIFVGVRWALLSESLVVRGWNSDPAIFGLMARRIVRGEGFDLFFFGQNYMGCLTSLFAAAVGAVRGMVTGTWWVGAAELRIGAMVEVACGILVAWAAVRRGFGAVPAALVLLASTLGPQFLFSTSVVPYGFEMVLLLGGIVTWLFLRGLGSAGERFFFGFFAAVGWWMNEGIAFLLVPIAWLLVLREPAEPVLGALRPGARLRFDAAELGWRPLGARERKLLLLVEIAIFVALGGAIVGDFDRRLWPFFVADPFLEPLGALLLIHAALEIRERGNLLRSVPPAIRGCGAALGRLRWAVAGAAVGFSPLLLGRVFGWYEVAYGATANLTSPAELPGRLRLLLGTDLWRFLGVDTVLGGAVVVSGVVVAVLAGKADRSVARSLFLGVIATTAAFFVFTHRGGIGSVRYAMAALVPTLALVADLAVRAIRRGGAARAAGVAFLLVGFASYGLVAARSVDEVRATPDPRPVLAAAEASGCRVVFADFWDAYLYDFLAGGRVRFAPWRSLIRTRREVELLLASPLPKCVYTAGRFRPYEPADSRPETSIRARERLRELRR